MQRVASGEFLVQSLGPGTWRINNLAAPNELVIVRGIRPEVPPPSGLATSLTLDWHAGDAVSVSLSFAAGTVRAQAAAALLHEFAERLYETLPLGEYTPAAARFWRRIFMLARVPGGRWMLGFLARRTRRGP